MKSEEVKNVKVHISAGQFQYIECELPAITDFEEVIKLASDMKLRELEARYTCKHDYYETYVSKAGKRYRECWNCFAQSYEDDMGNWSSWKMPIRSK